jgi:hypothetical protein
MEAVLGASGRDFLDVSLWNRIDEGLCESDAGVGCGCEGHNREIEDFALLSAGHSVSHLRLHSGSRHATGDGIVDLRHPLWNRRLIRIKLQHQAA